MAVDWEFMYEGSAGPGPGGRTDGWTDANGRTGGRGVLNESTTMFINYHKKQQKQIVCFDFSHHVGAQVPIFTAQMKKASNKCQETNVFYDFSNQANAQVPIFIDQNTIFGHRPGSPGSPGNGAQSTAPNPPTMRRGSG